MIMVTFLSIGYLKEISIWSTFWKRLCRMNNIYAEMTCCAACVAALIQHLEYYLQVIVQDNHHAEMMRCTAYDATLIWPY